MTVIFRMTDIKTNLKCFDDIDQLSINLRTLLTDADIFIIETGDVFYDLGTEAGHLEADAELMASKEMYVTFYSGNGAFTIRAHEGEEISFTVAGRKLLIKKAAICG